MVHRVYIYSNLKSPFVVHQYDQSKGCIRYNHVISRSPSFVIKKQVNFQEGEQCWLLPTTCPPTKLKPRTVCCQEGEDDEDMAPSDTNIDYKVSSFLHSNNDMHMWNQVNCTKNYCANVGTSSPYNQCSYPKVSCPHQQWSNLLLFLAKGKFYSTFSSPPSGHPQQCLVI
jgi:hypothetical protein